MEPNYEQIVAFLARLRQVVAENRIQVRSYALDGLRDLEWTAQQDAEKVRPWTFSVPLRRSEFGSAPGIIRLFQ
ncbi:MAG: hypothetical protein ACOYM9_19315, partial [Bradymonadia bacterium]